MSVRFTAEGLLPPGIHRVTWIELMALCGTTPWRLQLLNGFRAVCRALARAGCVEVWLDGSLVTDKDVPGDFDGCWDPVGVDPALLDPVLLDFSPGRLLQKAKYRGEMFIALEVADAAGRPFLEFFQMDKNSGDPKGIVSLDPRDVP